MHMYFLLDAISSLIARVSHDAVHPAGIDAVMKPREDPQIYMYSVCMHCSSKDLSFPVVASVCQQKASEVYKPLNFF